MAVRILKSTVVACVALLMIFSSAVLMRAAVDPQSYASIYCSLIKIIGNDQLVKNYHDNLRELQISGQPRDEGLGDELRIVRLPIFRVPILKIITTEMQRRKLINDSELEMVQKVIKEKEELMNRGGQGTL